MSERLHGFCIGIIVMLAITAILLTANILYEMKQYSDIDKEVLHYDANGYFAYVDVNSERWGLYDGPRVLGHLEGNIELEPGVYEFTLLVKGEEK